MVATEAGQAGLRAVAARLTGRTLQAEEALVGLRVTVPDRRPVVGWLDAERRRGVLAGLAAKGALWALILAGQWAEDLDGGGKIEAEAQAARYGGRQN
ncbi:MAG: hypothetical protein J6386_19240 [Candidatus Synoicihabitans palmerolidicus]|nr:hypothetical protein [Candidatus Synoicihabitans palmerolidicus]